MNTRRRIPSLQPLLVLLLISLTALPQTALQKAVEPTPTSIKGRVVSSDGQPVSGIQVVAVAIGKGFERRQMGAGFSQSTTDERGDFQIDGLRLASYVLSASSPGYVTLMPADESSPNIYRVGEIAQITLVKGGVITGKVTSGDDEPLTGVEVSAMRVGSVDGEIDVPTGPGGPGGGFVRNFRTDDRGVYRIYGLMPGSYVVRATMRRDNQPSATAAEAPTYHPSSARDNAVIVPLRAGDEVPGVDIRYRGERGRTVSGKVISRSGEGERGGGASIFLSVAGSGFTVNSTFQDLTDRGDSGRGPQGPGGAPGGRLPGGGFAFVGVPDGEYEIRARTNSARGDTDSASPIRKITVRGADVSGIELVLNPLASIDGKVVIEKGAVTCPVPRTYVIDEILVSTRRDGTDNWLRDEAPAFNGDFNLRGIDPGTYRLRVRFPGDNWYLKALQMPSMPNVAKTGIIIRSGQRVTGLSAVVADGAASLAGQLMKSDGEKLAGQAKVFIFPAETEAAENLLRFHQIVTREDGSFSLRNIAPGKYFVIPKAVTKDATRAEAQNFGQSVELTACQRLSGFKVSM